MLSFSFKKLDLILNGFNVFFNYTYVIIDFKVTFTRKDEFNYEKKQKFTK